MNKLELLAKLKQAYEVLNDILENGDTEIPHITISYIETEYNKVYDEISQTNEDALFITVKESDYSIGYSVNIDYQDRNNSEVYTSGDIGYEWWNDKSLIQQYKKELNNDETRENEPYKDDIEINHMEMETYEDENKAQIHTEILVKLAKLEDKYNIPDNQRVTVYEEVKDPDGHSEIYPFPKVEYCENNKDIIKIYDALRKFDEARETIQYPMDNTMDTLADFYDIKTIPNMLSEEQKHRIINDKEMSDGIIVSECMPIDYDYFSLSGDPAYVKVFDMVLLEKEQVNDEIEME